MLYVLLTFSSSSDALQIELALADLAVRLR